MRGIVGAVLERLLSAEGSVSARQVARAAGISRQAAHRHLKQLVDAGALEPVGKARACRYEKRVVAPLRTRLEVASAGSVYRLSARLLLDGVAPGEVTLDFTGVYDVGEEFLDEVFLVWAPKHRRVTLKVAHFPSKFAALLFGLAKKKRLTATGAAGDGAPVARRRAGSRAAG